MTPSDWVTILSCAGACAVSLIVGTWILSWKFADQKAIIDKQVSEVREKTDQDEAFKILNQACAQ